MKKQNSKTLCVFMSILFAAACFLFATAELTDSGYYKISANRLPSALVEGNGERVVQNEQAGYLTYGPYTHLPRGKYTVTVTYSCTGSGNFVDIASQTGAVIHKKQDLTVNSTECHINFSVADAVDDLEIRTFYGGNGELSVESIQITALPNQLKPAVLLFAGVFFLIEPARYLWKELLVIMGKGRIRKGVVIGCSIFLFSMLFGVSIHNSLTNGSKRVLFAVSIVCGLLCESAYRNKHMEKYFSLSSMIAILAVSLYASLATFFYRFFLAEERMVFSVRGCAYVLLGTLWWLSIVFSALYLMELLSTKIRDKASVKGEEPHTRNRKRAFVCLFLVLCVCQAIGVMAFWPGGFQSDTTDQLNQALGNAPLNDWHPVFYTVFFRLILSIIPEPGMIVVVQSLFFVLLCTMILMIGYDSGISLKWLILLGGVFLLLPNQMLSNICVVKDFPYTVSLLWGTWLLFRLVQDIAVCKKLWYSFSLIVDLFFIACLRHNGILPFLMIVLLCVILTIAKYSQVRYRLIIAVLIASLSIGIFKGPIYKKLEVIPSEVSTYTTMMVAVGSCINKDLPLSEEATEIMQSVATLEVWRDYYNRFAGHDDYLWGRAEGTTFNMTHITARQAFRVYLEALIKYPDVVIKDRLDGTNIMWDISQPTESFNTKSFDTIYNASFVSALFNVENLKLDVWGHYYKDSPLAQFYRKTMNTSIHSLADMLLWRSGVYLVLMLIMFIFWWKNKMGRMLWAATPMLSNIAGSLLVLYHQSFRYVYFIQVIVLALLFLTVCSRNDRSADEIINIGEM